MFSRFFIDRPIFASVIAIIIVIAGLVAQRTLPIAQYPDIVPPTVQVSANYPGANAKTVAETVATTIEQEVNGVEGMLYMSSNSSNDGSYKLTVTFDVGTDLDFAQVLVQNRVATAENKLPEDVRRQGVTTKKQSPNILFMIALSSPDGRYDNLYLSNYAALRIRDELSRIPGVGDVQIFGASDYSMRIWLDPNKLLARNMTTDDIVAALREQNVQVAAGQIGQAPAPRGQNFTYTINTLGRLSDPEQFGSIIVRTDGSRITRLRDVARVELGGQDYNLQAQLNGKPAAAIGVYQLPGANALNVADQVLARMAELSKAFPPGLQYSVPFDTTRFVKASIEEVYKTLFEAAILVFVVILVFLQDWRATLIPAVTIPVSLIGTFAVMAAMGFSINTLTLFGLVLAIGIVVDDAIVVVENVWHHMEKDGVSAREATVRAMAEISGPVIAITLVLMSVFIPTAFLPGITGQMYRQFALTIAVSTGFSALNALTLSPALCALLLRPPRERKFILYRAFNAGFGRVHGLYGRTAGFVVRRVAIMLLLFVGIAAATGWGFMSLPTGFLPKEDQGYFLANIQLPDAASQERTSKVLDKVNQVLRTTPGVDQWVAINGLSILDQTRSTNIAAVFISLKDWSERTDPSLNQEAILMHLRKAFSQIQDGVVMAFIPPSINGLGNAGGLQMQVEDKGGVGLNTLQQMVEEMVRDGSAQSGLRALNAPFRASVPQLYVDIDRVKAKTLNVPLDNVFNALQSYLGSVYINDFNTFNRVYQVRAQAEPGFRSTVDDIGRIEVRNNDGKMVPLGTLVHINDMLGPSVINRYNLYPSAYIIGEPAPGYSSGQALTIMEQMAQAKLPASMGYDWTTIAYQQKKVGSEAGMIFALAVVLVLLVLAAQYESWTNPVAVVLVVPLALLGTVLALAVRGLDNNVYTQIGIVLIIALASKNAILIVEFAREQRAQGKSVREAAVEAAKLRFRPILMTSFAFILGVVPLAIATGAGAASRQALGTAVFGGMIAATLLGVLFVPVFFVAMQGLTEYIGSLRTRRKRAAEEKAIAAK